MCSRLGCYKRPHYGNPGGKALYCVTHKEPAMVNIHGRRCQHADCDKQPTFGFKGEKAMYCSGHREPQMVDVVYKRCEFPGGCEKHPHFGAEGEKARFCGRHKTDGMVNVKHRRCQQPGCRRERLFTDDPNAKPLYCSLHLAYQQRGIDPRSCDLDLPPGLASPVPSSKGRSSNATSASRNGGVHGNGTNDANGGGGSNSSGSSGKGGNRGGVGTTGEAESSGSSLTSGGGLLPGLNIGSARSTVSPGIHLGIPPSRESVAGSAGSNTISAGAKKRASRMEMVEDDARSALQEQHMHGMQAHPSQRRMYEAQHRQALGVGGGGGAATASSGSSSLATSQAVRYDSRGFGAQTEQISFSGISAYSPATSSVPGSGFVDAPIPPRNSISSVSSVSGGGSIGMIGNGSAGPNMVTPGRLAPQSSMPQANATGPYAWSGACRGPSNSSGPGARMALGSGSSFSGAGVGISSGAGGVADMGGSVEGNQDMKPPPTEPPVHGPLHQYSGRNTGGGSMSAAASSGNLAPVRLPGLGGVWGASPSSAPTVLPGISNFRHLSAAAGAMLAETSGSPRQWSAYDAPPGTAPSSAQQRSSAAQDAAAVADGGHTLLRASQQHQGHDAGIPGGDGGQDIQQLLPPGWGGGSGSSAFQAFGGNLDGLDGLSWDQHQQHQLSQQHHQQRQRQLLVHQPRQHLPPSSQSQHHLHQRQHQHQLHQQQHPHHAGQQHLQHQQHLPSEQDQHNPSRLGASPQGFGGVRVPGPLHRLS